MLIWNFLIFLGYNCASKKIHIMDQHVYFAHWRRIAAQGGKGYKGPQFKIIHMSIRSTPEYLPAHICFNSIFLLWTLGLIDWVSLGANAVKIIWNA